MSAINKDIRSQIASAVVDRAFKAEQDASIKVQGKLLKRVWDGLYSPLVKKAIAAMQVSELYCEKEAVQKVSKIMVSVGGWMIEVGSPNSKESVFILGVQKSWQTLATFDANDPLGVEIKTAEEVESDIEERKSAERRKIMALLNTCKSNQSLAEKWPEVMSIAQPFLSTEVKANLPALLRQDLNLSLGLPADIVEEEKELEAA
jgi:hypothetical protein